MRSFFIGFAVFMMYAVAPLTIMWWVGEELQGRPRFRSNTDQKMWSDAGTALPLVILFGHVPALLIWVCWHLSR